MKALLALLVIIRLKLWKRWRKKIITKEELKKELIRFWREWHREIEPEDIPKVGFQFEKGFYACAEFIQGEIKTNNKKE